MLERAARAAYEEMIGRAWREFPDEPVDSPLRVIDRWENLSEATRENWRATVAAALKVYAADPHPERPWNVCSACGATWEEAVANPNSQCTHVYLGGIFRLRTASGS